MLVPDTVPVRPRDRHAAVGEGPHCRAVRLKLDNT